MAEFYQRKITLHAANEQKKRRATACAGTFFLKDTQPASNPRAATIAQIITFAPFLITRYALARHRCHNRQTGKVVLNT